MIRSFADAATAALFAGRMAPKGIDRELARQAQKKLTMVDQAAALGDLAARRGNELEKLAGDREGQWSVRVNRQWRICFVWRDGDAHEVWFGDYH